MDTRPPLWTLDELCAQAALALATDHPGQVSGRVRDVPDRRMVRYYTTLGLLDRPAALRGRTALYSRRHLLQLVAIKRLQVHGLSLTEIQERLLGQTDAALEPVARLPEPKDEPRGQEAIPSADEETPGTAFWKREPSPPKPAEAEAIRPLLAVPLTEGVTLLLHATRSVDETDLETIRAAAGPLLHLLHKRRLVTDAHETKAKESR